MSWGSMPTGQDSSVAAGGIETMHPDEKHGGSLPLQEAFRRCPSPIPSRQDRKRVVGEAGLEPAKLTQGIYSPPPLPLGTFPQRVFVPLDIKAFGP